MPRKALVKIRAISDSKDTCRYSQIRGKFCVFRGLLSPHKFGQRLSVPCETTSRRRFAKLCAFAWEIFAHRKHRNTQNLLRMLLRKSAPSAWNHNAPQCILCIPCETIPPPQGISVNSCPLVAQKIREDMSQYMEKSLCSLVIFTCVNFGLPSNFISNPGNFISNPGNFISKAWKFYYQGMEFFFLGMKIDFLGMKIHFLGMKKT